MIDGLGLNEIGTDYTYVFNDSVDSKLSNTSVKRDIVNPNRYFFNFPPEWRTSNFEERIIGFRGLHIIRRTRAVEFTIEISSGSTSLTRYIFFTLSADDDLHVFEEKLKTQLGTNYGEIIQAKVFPMMGRTENIVYKGKYWCAYDRPSAEGDYWNTNGNIYGIRIISIDTTVKFRIIGLNTDTINLLNAHDYVNDQTLFYDGIDFFNLWDRRNVLMKSSLVSGVANNYIGTSNHNFNPLKYFKITSTDTQFYIDFHLGQYSFFEAFLPLDNTETIILEIVLY
jgi:hypothetical protein